MKNKNKNIKGFTLILSLVLLVAMSLMGGTLVVLSRIAAPIISSALANLASVYIHPLKGPGSPPFDKVPTPLFELIIFSKIGFN